jgi:hypothetical protein
MTSPARYYALQWFHDHEALGPDGVFGRKPPSVRMRKLMSKEGDITNEPVGQFKYLKWILSPAGRAKLQNKPPPRRRSMPDANDGKRKQNGQPTPR